MALTLTLTEGVLPPGQERVAFQRLSAGLLTWTGLAGNKFMTAALVGSIHLLPRGQTFGGMQEGAVALIEWKVPSIAFTDRDVQVGYIAEATQIIHELSGGRHPKERVWVTVLHAVDGAWGIGGRALTNDQLEAEIGKG